MTARAGPSHTPDARLRPRPAPHRAFLLSCVFHSRYHISTFPSCVWRQRAFSASSCCELVTLVMTPERIRRRARTPPPFPFLARPQTRRPRPVLNLSTQKTRQHREAPPLWPNKAGLPLHGEQSMLVATFSLPYPVYILRRLPPLPLKQCDHGGARSAAPS